MMGNTICFYGEIWIINLHYPSYPFLYGAQDEVARNELVLDLCCLQIELFIIFSFQTV